MASPFGILVKFQNFSFQKNLWCCCTNGVMCVYHEKTQAATPCIMERVKTICFFAFGIRKKKLQVAEVWAVSCF